MCRTCADRVLLWASTHPSSNSFKKKCSPALSAMVYLSFQIQRKTLGLSSLSCRQNSMLRQLVTYQTITSLDLRNPRRALIRLSQSPSIKAHPLTNVQSVCRRKFPLNLSPVGTCSNALPTGNIARKSLFLCSINNKDGKTSQMVSIVLMSLGFRLAQTQ